MGGVGGVGGVGEKERERSGRRDAETQRTRREKRERTKDGTGGTEAQRTGRERGRDSGRSSPRRGQCALHGYFVAAQPPLAGNSVPRRGAPALHGYFNPGTTRRNGVAYAWMALTPGSLSLVTPPPKGQWLPYRGPAKFRRGGHRRHIRLWSACETFDDVPVRAGGLRGEAFSRDTYALHGYFTSNGNPRQQ